MRKINNFLSVSKGLSIIKIKFTNKLGKLEYDDDINRRALNFQSSQI